MLQGTLDMLILQTLVMGPAHGHGIANSIEQRSDDLLQVEHGSLYPALYRLEDREWIVSGARPRTTEKLSTIDSRHLGASSWPSPRLDGTGSQLASVAS